jgi:hypothetical protein
MKRTLVWIAGLLLFTAMLVAILTTPVYGDRGRDEINLFSIYELEIGSGTVLTQPVPLQRDEAYAIDLPYRWVGSCGRSRFSCRSELKPARVQARLTSSDGAVLSDTIESLGDTRAPYWLQPTGDGSFLQDYGAAFHAIRLPPKTKGTVLLSLTRVDGEPGPLVFFVSDVAHPGAGSRPTILERPGQTLDLQTEYGAPRPALAKAPVFVSRVQSLAPPWLPFPLPELLLAGVVATGIFLYTRILFAPAGEPLDEALSPPRSR